MRQQIGVTIDIRLIEQPVERATSFGHRCKWKLFGRSHLNDNVNAGSGGQASSNQLGRHLSGFRIQLESLHLQPPRGLNGGTIA